MSLFNTFENIETARNKWRIENQIEVATVDRKLNENQVEQYTEINCKQDISQPEASAIWKPINKSVFRPPSSFRQ